jgi:hypothetical protein
MVSYHTSPTDILMSPLSRYLVQPTVQVEERVQYSSEFLISGNLCSREGLRGSSPPVSTFHAYQVFLLKVCHVVLQEVKYPPPPPKTLKYPPPPPKVHSPLFAFELYLPAPVRVGCGLDIECTGKVQHVRGSFCLSCTVMSEQDVVMPDFPHALAF